MEYLAKYISSSMAEIIKCPANPESLLEAEKAKLEEMRISELEIDPKEIKAQEEIINLLDAQVKRYSELMEDGFVEFVNTDEPETESGQTIQLSYELRDGKVYQIWTIVGDLSYYQKQIENLKQELASSDYKIIKCNEASLIGESLPYDILKLHTDRQALRDEISLIENVVANL